MGNAATLVAVTLAACGSGTGSLEIRLEAEDSITDGLTGDGEEAIVDGWSVTFDKFIVVAGPVHVGGGAFDPVSVEATVAVDLTQVPVSGLPLATFEEMAARAWPEIRFDTPSATADTERDASVSQADFDRMVADACTYLVVGTMTSPEGERCPRGGATCSAAASVGFDLCIPAPTVYGPCQTDTGISGVTITAGATQTANFTVHGDHLFFNGFPEGAEGSVARRAQWLVNADVDEDGTVTRSDLEAIGASDLGTLLPSTFADGLPGFTLGGHPIVDADSPDIDDAWEYLRAQMMTNGHFQGEGDCPWTAAD